MYGIEEILKLVCKNFNDNNIDYVIVGGFTVIFYGNPRTTMDLDIVMQIPKNTDISAVVKFFKENGFFASEEDMKCAFAEKSNSTVEYKETMFRIDIKGVYDEMGKRTIKNNDIRDAIGIYVRQTGKLDEKYLQEFAKKQGVYDELLKIKEKIKNYNKI